MPLSQFGKILHAIAKLTNDSGMGTRHGVVHEVKEAGGERKFRVELGKKKDGSPWLSPWYHSEEHRGGSSSQQLIEKGQSVIITVHGGDFRNATASPSAESEKFPQPNHAPQFNGDSSQLGKVRTATNKPSQDQSSGDSSGGGAKASSGSGSKHTHSVWIDKQDSSQGGQGGGQGDGKPDPQVIAHLNEDGSFTARSTTECRIMAAPKGSKMKTKQAHAVVTKDGKHIVRKPWIIGKDPLDDNDSV